MDGNFVSDHIRMQHPEDDIPLADGHGFMVPYGRYGEHLQDAIDTREVCLSGMFDLGSQILNWSSEIKV